MRSFLRLMGGEIKKMDEYDDGFYFFHNGIGAYLDDDLIPELDAFLDDEAFVDIVLSCIDADDERFEERKQNTANWLREQIAQNN